MRGLKLMFVLGVLGGAVSGCSCAGKEFTVKQSFAVASGADSALCTTNRQTVNLQEDSAFDSLKSNIGKVELQKLVVTILDPNTNGQSVATTGTGAVKVSALSQGAVVADLGTYSAVPIAAGSTQNITFDPAAASALATLVLDPPNSFDVIADGCNDRVPAFYTFEVVMTFFAELKLF
jgi:hypothetical protein